MRRLFQTTPPLGHGMLAVLVLASLAHSVSATVCSTVSSISDLPRSGASLPKTGFYDGKAKGVVKSSTTASVYYILTSGNQDTYDSIQWSATGSSKRLQKRDMLNRPVLRRDVVDEPYCFLTKFTNGAKEWTRALPNGRNGQNSGTCQSMAIDASDNLYVSGEFEFTGTGVYDYFLAKYVLSTSGITESWKIKVADDPTKGNGSLESSVLVSGSDIYVHTNEGTNKMQTRVTLVREANGVGAISKTWPTLGPAFTSTSDDELTSVGAQMAYDSSTGDLYVTMSTLGTVDSTFKASGRRTGTTNRDCMLLKLTSGSTSPSWISNYTTSSTDVCYGVSFINSAPYLYGYSTASSGKTGFIQRLSSAGAVQWTKTGYLTTKGVVQGPTSSTLWVAGTASNPADSTYTVGWVSLMNADTGAEINHSTVAYLDMDGDLAGLPVVSDNSGCGLALAGHSDTDAFDSADNDPMFYRGFLMVYGDSTPGTDQALLPTSSSTRSTTSTTTTRASTTTTTTRATTTPTTMTTTTRTTTPTTTTATTTTRTTTPTTTTRTTTPTTTTRTTTPTTTTTTTTPTTTTTTTTTPTTTTTTTTSTTPTTTTTTTTSTTPTTTTTTTPTTTTTTTTTTTPTTTTTTTTSTRPTTTTTTTTTSTTPTTTTTTTTSTTPTTTTTTTTSTTPTTTTTTTTSTTPTTTTTTTTSTTPTTTTTTTTSTTPTTTTTTTTSTTPTTTTTTTTSTTPTTTTTTTTSTTPTTTTTTTTSTTPTTTTTTTTSTTPTTTTTTSTTTTSTTTRATTSKTTTTVDVLPSTIAVDEARIPKTETTLTCATPASSAKELTIIGGRSFEHAPSDGDGSSKVIMKSAKNENVYYLLSTSEGDSYDAKKWSDDDTDDSNGNGNGNGNGNSKFRRDSAVSFMDPYCFLTKFINGKKHWTKPIRDAAQKSPAGKCQSAALDDDDNLYITGQFPGDTSVWDFVLAKYAVGSSIKEQWKMSIVTDPTAGVGEYESAVFVNGGDIFVHTNEPTNQFQTRVTLVNEVGGTGAIVRTWKNLGPSTSLVANDTLAPTSVGALMAYNASTGDLYVTMSTLGTVTGANNLISAGRKDLTTDRDCLLIKIPNTWSASSTAWVQVYNQTASSDDICMGVTLIKNYLYLYGYSSSSALGGSVGFMQKYSIDGTKQWSRSKRVHESSNTVKGVIQVSSTNKLWVVGVASSGWDLSGYIAMVDADTGETSSVYIFADLTDEGDLGQVPVVNGGCEFAVAGRSSLDVLNPDSPTDNRRSFVLIFDKGSTTTTTSTTSTTTSTTTTSTTSTTRTTTPTTTTSTTSTTRTTTPTTTTTTTTTPTTTTTTTTTPTTTTTETTTTPTTTPTTTTTETTTTTTTTPTTTTTETTTTTTTTPTTTTTETTTTTTTTQTTTTTETTTTTTTTPTTTTTTTPAPPNPTDLDDADFEDLTRGGDSP